MPLTPIRVISLDPSDHEGEGAQLIDLELPISSPLEPISHVRWGSPIDFIDLETLTNIEGEELGQER